MGNDWRDPPNRRDGEYSCWEFAVTVGLVLLVGAGTVAFALFEGIRALASH